MNEAMTPSLLDLLPASVQSVVRRTFVPPHIRTLLANLPDPLTLDVRLVEQGSALPTVVRQLVKLGLSSGTCKLERVTLVQDFHAMELVVSRAGRQHVVAEGQLGSDLPTVVKEVLQSLFHPAELPDLLERLAFQTSTLATLQTITRHMLSMTEEDRALYLVLAGITAGYSLGFNRAVLFTRDAATGRYVGSKAIGPLNVEEAHRVWEAIEVDEKSIEDVIQDQGLAPVDSPFQRFVHGLGFDLSSDEEDEMAVAFRSEGPILFQRTTPHNPALRELGAGGEYVVAVIRSRKKEPGFIFADNLYTRSPITSAHVRFFRFFMDQTALVLENLLLLKEVEMLARYDSLTGLFNRREFNQQVAEQSARVLRARRTCALLVIDLDFFKEVNDRQGHEAGDRTLKTLGRIMRESLRSTDILGRFGGDEFVAFLTDLGMSDLNVAVERVGKAAKQVGISLSVGAAMYPRDCDDPTALFALADANLYTAKRAGRGCACLPGGTLMRF